MESPIQHPELERIRQRCAEQRIVLKELVEAEHHLSTVERPRLTVIYDTAFGDIEVERQQLAIRSAEMARRVELLSIKVARGETLTPETIDLVNKVVDREYMRFRQRLREAFNMDSQQREEEARNHVSNADEDDLVNMYRTLAKNLHPDAVGESLEKRSAWDRVQSAYQQRDARQLRTLLTVLGANDLDEERTSTWDLEHWEREDRELAARIRMEKRKLDRLRAEEPLCIAKELENTDWVNKHRRELEAELLARKNEFAEHREHYSHLTHGHIAAGTSVVDSQEEQNFQDEFIKNTYFSGHS